MLCFYQGLFTFHCNHYSINFKNFLSVTNILACTFLGSFESLCQGQRCSVTNMWHFPQQNTFDSSNTTQYLCGEGCRGWVAVTNVVQKGFFFLLPLRRLNTHTVGPQNEAHWWDVGSVAGLLELSWDLAWASQNTSIRRTMEQWFHNEFTPCFNL